MQARQFICDLHLSIDPTLVLFPFVHGVADVRTVTFVKQLMEMGETVIWGNVKGCLIGYGLLFSGYWNRGGDLIVIEHDVLPTLRMVYEMATCPHEVCMQLYKLHPESTKLPKSVYCVEGLPTQFNGDFTSGGGFGFIRFKASVQKKVGAVTCHYSGLDTRWMEKAVKVLGANFVHVHYPEMPHFHGCEVC